VFHKHKVDGLEETAKWRLRDMARRPETRGTQAVVRAYVGLGANLGDREAAIRRAVELLGAEPDTEVVAVSRLRETEPVGGVEQPRFLNGAAALETELRPRKLLERLLAVERELGRDRARERRWGPRTLDLDLLLYGDEVIDEPGLTVPHPRLAERRFVLEPLDELDAQLTLPDGRRVADLLRA
jgi:2-amino-4-hydroxy-6-hydroxymethyldihydropteridine diphosphokinase